jgi:hypothetical protein
MAKVKVLSVAIADEHPRYLVCEAYEIELPIEYIGALTYGGGYPSFDNYAYWDTITEQLEEATSFATCTFDIAGKIGLLNEQAKDEGFAYDPECLASGEAGREDLAMNFTIERLRLAFTCNFVHNSRA